ncbi:MAG: hypothetical protein H5T74_12010 [Actinobacteria bacterium]|nr:hypothetical protein [Actinomycetota bacterium]
MEKMRIRRCRQCGFAYWLARSLEWHDNGTITSRFREDYRTLIIEADFLSEIFKAIEEAIGATIGHVVFEAQRRASKDVIDMNLARIRWAIRHVPGLYRGVILYFNRLASWCGQAYSRTVRNDPRGPSQAIIRNPFNRDLMAAIVTGALESLFEVPYDHHWEKRGADDVIVVEPTGEHPEICERLAYSTPAPTGGGRAFELCPSCGAPHRLSVLDWDPDRGTVTDTRRGIRVVFLEIYTTNVVLRELVRELGEDIVPVIVEAQRNFSLTHIGTLRSSGDARPAEKDRKAFMEEALDTIALYGQGNPTVLENGEKMLRISVENPFNEYVLAGHLSALYELLEGERAKVEWEFPHPSTAVFTLTA